MNIWILHKKILKMKNILYILIKSRQEIIIYLLIMKLEEISLEEDKLNYDYFIYLINYLNEIKKLKFLVN